MQALSCRVVRIVLILKYNAQMRFSSVLLNEKFSVFTKEYLCRFTVMHRFYPAFYGKALHKQMKFGRCKFSQLITIPWPLKTSGLNTLIKKQKTVTFPDQLFRFFSYSDSIGLSSKVQRKTANTIGIINSCEPI